MIQYFAGQQALQVLPGQHQGEGGGTAHHRKGNALAIGGKRPAKAGFTAPLWLVLHQREMYGQCLQVSLDGTQRYLMSSVKQSLKQGLCADKLRFARDFTHQQHQSKRKVSHVLSCGAGFANAFPSGRCPCLSLMMSGVFGTGVGIQTTYLNVQLDRSRLFKS